MENKCLITTYQGELSEQNLPKFGDLMFFGQWKSGSTSVNFYYGPGTVNNKLDDDFTITVLEGGSINEGTTVTIPKGSVVNQFAYITITRSNEASDLKLLINSQYTLNGFGFNSNRVINFSLKQSDLVKFVNINRVVLEEAYDSTINITSLIEGLYSNGWRKSAATVYCYNDFQYALYDGDSHVSTASKDIVVSFNASMTEYTLSITNTVVAKRKLVGGVWASQPTT